MICSISNKWILGNNKCLLLCAIFLFSISLRDVLAHGAGNHKNRHLTAKINKSHEKDHEIHHHQPSSKLMKMIQNLVDVQSISSTDSCCNSNKEEKLEIQRNMNSMAHAIKIDIFPPDESYDKHTAPPLVNGQPNKIEATMDILSIPSLDEKKEEIMIEVRVTHIWKDSRLLTSKLPSSVELEPSSLADLWTPDSYFHHTKELKFVRLMTTAASMVIHPDQTIKYSVMVMLTIGCPMEFQDYPMDKQVCHLQMQSFSHDIDHNTYHWLRPPHIQKNINLDNHEVDIKEYNFTYELEGLVYPGLGVKIELKRHLGFHLTQSYMPSTMFVIVGWISFMVPSDAIPGRMVVCVTTLLTLTSMFDSVRTMTPQVSYMKAIDLWVFVCLVFVFSTLVEYGLILYLTSRSSWQRKIDQLHKMLYEGTADVYQRNSFLRKIKSKRKRHKKDQIEMSGVPNASTDSPCSSRNNKTKLDTDTNEISDPLMIDIENGTTTGTKLRWKEMLAYKIEFYVKVVYPILFFLFNIVYWLYYT